MNRTLAFLSLIFVAACGTTESMSGTSDCTPEIILTSASHTTVTNKDGATPLVMSIGVQLPDSSCGKATPVSLDFGGITQVLGTEMMVSTPEMDGMHLLTGLRWFDCPAGVCRRELELDSNGVTIGSSYPTWLDVHGSSFHQGPSSTFTPKLYGFAWRTAGGAIEHANYNPPLTGAAVTFHIN